MEIPWSSIKLCMRFESKLRKLNAIGVLLRRYIWYCDTISTYIRIFLTMFSECDGIDNLILPLSDVLTSLSPPVIQNETLLWCCRNTPFVLYMEADTDCHGKYLDVLFSNIYIYTITL